jgi:O-antigen ligase/Tfp pilus assembly protein PilF
MAWLQLAFRVLGLASLGLVSLLAMQGALSCSRKSANAAKAALALVAVTGFSAAMSIHRGKSLEAMLNVLAILGLFLLAALLLRGLRMIRGVAVAQILAALPVAALGLAQHFRPDLLPADSSYPGRALGPFGQPNRLGGFLIAAIPLALALAFAAQSSGARALLLGAVFGLTLCLVFTYSRGAWIGLLAGLAALGFLVARWPELRPQPAFLAAALLTLLLPALFALPSVVSRIAPRPSGAAAPAWNLPFDPEREGSAAMRRSVWSGALRATLERPVAGWGPGAFREAFDRAKGATMKRLEAEGGRTADQAHSLYLVLSAERGVLGLAAFSLLVGLILAGGLGAGSPAEARLLSAGLLASLVALLAHAALEDNALLIPHGTILYANLGLLAAAAPGAKSAVRGRGLGLVGLAVVVAGIAVAGMSATAGAAAIRAREAVRSGDALRAMATYAAAARMAPWDDRYAIGAAKAAEAASTTGMSAARIGSAATYYRRAIAANPSDPVTRHELARLYLAHSDIFGESAARDAAAELRAALAQNPYYAEVRNDLGVALLRMGDREGAVNAFRRAGDGRREFVDPLLNLAALAQERGDRAEAARWIDAALERNPGSVRGLAMQAALWK